jgi:cysteinyl-tRNA synthetase
MKTMLQIYNSLTRRKEAFVPMESGRVRMYVCGITVYDFCHVGHARMMVVFDVLYRYLQARGFEVTYVRNITDIDDKIINRAHESGETVLDLTARFTQAMHEDTDALGVLRPTVEPKATDNIDAIQRMMATLISKGYAYQADNGDIYYAVSRFPHYGALSGKNPADLRAGARVEIGEAKRDPLDFVLWKAAKPGEPSWDSPWGPGRPGWHIECSAMATELLGARFDIHGGGQDLQFPHHENEIAQSEACNDQTFVNYWIHNGFVRVNEEKMSKSLGNFFTVREVLQVYQPEELRYFIVASHYRSPLNYADEQLDNARAALTRFYTALRALPEASPPKASDYETRFFAAMDDDLNTPEALAILFDLARDINKAKQSSGTEAAALGALLTRLGSILGLLQDEPERYLKGMAFPRIVPGTGLERDSTVAPAVHLLSDDDIEALIDQRNQARQSRHWSEADRIRDQLKQQGILLEDGASGTTWRRE